MKALFIACDQALYDEVQQKMTELGVRGYTSWEEVQGFVVFRRIRLDFDYFCHGD